MKSTSVAFLVLLMSIPVDALADRDVSVPLGGGRVINLGGIRGEAEITDPSIASFRAYGRDLLISGKKIGETNLLIKSPNGNAEWAIRVTMPAAAVQTEIDKLFPSDRVVARAVGGSIVLTGTVGSIIRVKEVEQVALGYLRSPQFVALGLQPHVINMLSVKTPQQVQLEVKFAEVNRRSFRELGANVTMMRDPGGGSMDTIGGAGIGDTAVSSIGNIERGDDQALTGGAGAVRAMPAANSFGTFFFGTQFGSFPFAATLSMLAQHNLSRTLAEPTLVAMSGQQATFLAGGEVPFQKSNGLNDTSIEFKQFGVELAFKPTVLSDSTIQLNTMVALSAPDLSFNLRGPGGVSTFGFKRRSSDTTVRLKDGQSFAIAGLLIDELSKITAAVPGLSSLPIIGILFKSKRFERQETELVVVVTVRLVDPMEQNQIPPLPGSDGPTDPTDLQMFLLNMDSPKATKPKKRRVKKRRTPSGRLGFQR